MFEEKFTKNDMLKLQNILRKLNHTITTAESCTGGLIASRITSISGSSDIFHGGIITYANHIKESELNVQKETMIKYGVVSKEVVKEMLDGVLKKFDANYAIAVSGVAGPGGGTVNKPVGTVVIGVANNINFVDVEIYHLKGSRIQIQKQATNIALNQILKFLKNCLDK
ncbi:MAG: CinA family protein [Arcobacteraceae bacterium]|nr:CinA family protein [Arcobacteraceae bacterium]